MDRNVLANAILNTLVLSMDSLLLEVWQDAEELIETQFAARSERGRLELTFAEDTRGRGYRVATETHIGCGDLGVTVV